MTNRNLMHFSDKTRMTPCSGRFSSSNHRGEGDEKNPRGTEAKRSRAGAAGNAGRRREKSARWPPRCAGFFTPPLDPFPHAEALRAELQSAMTAWEEVLAKDFRIGPAR